MTDSKEVDPHQEPPKSVDLEQEAANAAANPGKPPVSSSSFDPSKPFDEWPESIRNAVESRTSQAVNKAREKWDEKFLQNRANQTQDKETQPPQMSEERILELIEKRETARRSLSSTLEQQGIKKGTPAYDKFASYYKEQVEAGRITPEVLLSQAGVNSLVLLSGALLTEAEAEAAGPQHGYSTSDGIPLSVVNGDERSINEPEEMKRARETSQRIRDRLRGGKDSGNITINWGEL
jgi:hypothetical protein